MNYEEWLKWREKYFKNRKNLYKAIGKDTGKKKCQKKIGKTYSLGFQ